MYSIMLSAYSDSFISSLPIWMPRFFFLIDMYLTYDVVFISSVQQSDAVINITEPRFWLLLWQPWNFHMLQVQPKRKRKKTLPAMGVRGTTDRKKRHLDFQGVQM